MLAGAAATAAARVRRGGGCCARAGVGGAAVRGEGVGECLVSVDEGGGDGTESVADVDITSRLNDSDSIPFSALLLFFILVLSCFCSGE